MSLNFDPNSNPSLVKRFHIIKKPKKKCVVIVHFNYFWNFRVFLARQPQGVIPDRFPPFIPCANEFSLPFSYTKTLARP
jgi:hypothetical protein